MKSSFLPRLLLRAWIGVNVLALVLIFAFCWDLVPHSGAWTSDNRKLLETFLEKSEPRQQIDSELLERYEQKIHDLFRHVFLLLGLWTLLTILNVVLAREYVYRLKRELA